MARHIRTCLRAIPKRKIKQHIALCRPILMNLLRSIQRHVTGYPRLNCYILSLLYIHEIETYKNGHPSYTVYFNDPAKRKGKKIVTEKKEAKAKKKN